jgi:hypothetical protein
MDDSIWKIIFFFQSIIMIVIGCIGYRNHRLKKLGFSSENSRMKNYFILISKQFSIIFIVMGFLCLIMLALSIF